jgi:hypothetical protein
MLRVTLLDMMNFALQRYIEHLNFRVVTSHDHSIAALCQVSSVNFQRLSNVKVHIFFHHPFLA